ncbi:MAG: sigma-54-dependent Fis family transcriptional regulator [Methylococcaceae bacterium]|nr:sigma-54-dependent Fis family transcriptional regulator [Methylococcaceae bacterium]
MPKRNLIIFQPSKFGNEIRDQLTGHQWAVYVANDLKQASELFNRYTFYAGLCVLGTCESSLHLAQINRLVQAHSQCNWVMGLPKECTPDINPNSVESKLIADYCYDYITIPVDTERLLFSLGHAHGMNEISQPYLQTIDSYPSSYGIIGSSPAMTNLFSHLHKVAKEDCAVLIEGETGTGKELVANAIHKHSRRFENPFVAINCGAYPKELIQSELFGYEKGAFTGAQQRRVGLIESAQGGTLFLDEVGDLPLEQQVNLLRFLEERMIERIGGTAKIPIDVRIIAATNVDLKDAVLKKEFREDLYYRLRVLQMKTPPLRSRDDDVELLAGYFFNKFSSGQRYKAKGFHTDSLYMMKKYDWPGNVREMMNCVRHAVVMSENRLLTPTDLGLDRRYKDRVLQTLDEARSLADKEAIVTCLRHTNYNMSRAAESLGISRVSLYRLIEKYELSMSA